MGSIKFNDSGSFTLWYSYVSGKKLELSEEGLVQGDVFEIRWENTENVLTGSDLRKLKVCPTALQPFIIQEFNRLNEGSAEFSKSTFIKILFDVAKDPDRFEKFPAFRDIAKEFKRHGVSSEGIYESLKERAIAEVIEP